MRKIYFIAFLICISSIQLHAQGGVWTWMKGSQTPNSLGSYGVQGVAAASNNPPNRYQAAYWRDLQGNFWVFGGSSRQGLNIVIFNDLWKYSVSTNQWTWMSGPQYLTDQNGQFGTQGIPSTSNYPSARGNGSICWVDNTGMFWLYAGEGIDANNATGIMSDLWRYDPNTNEWTWVKGSNLINQSAVYGIQGIPSISNSPGPRCETQSGWVDNANDLWLSGGNNSSSASNFLGDLWRYNIASNTWTWMKGPSAVNQPGNFGAMGIEDPANQPPPRWSYTKWKSNDGAFYTFAGLSQIGTTNDTWRFNPATNNWTWISGNATANPPGNYNVTCSPNTNNFPPARYENQTAQTVSCSDVFWTFGGRSFSLNNYNDLWIFNTKNLEWTWVSGNNVLNNLGSFGTQGVASPSNMISARFGVNMWTDSLNNVWIFGGQNGTNYFNDLWRFQPDTSCFSAPLVASFQLLPPADSVICFGDTVKIDIPSTANVSWQPSTAVYPNNDTSILYFAPLGNVTYTVTGIDTGKCPGSDTLIFSVYINSSNPVSLSPPVDTVICPGEITTMPLDPNLTISYSPAFGVTPNSDTSILSFAPSITTTYSVIGQYGNCSIPDTSTFTIVVQNQGQISLFPAAPPVICAGESSTMNINPAYSVSWHPLTDVSANIDTSILTFTPPVSTAFTVIASVGGSCPATDSLTFEIKVNQSTKINIPQLNDTTLCGGGTIMISTINPGEKFTFVAPSGTEIFNGDSSIVFLTPLTQTTYTIMAAGGPCTIPDTMIFGANIKPSPTANFSLSPTTATLQQAYFTLTNQSQNANSYLWYLNKRAFSTAINETKQIKTVGPFCFQLVASNTSGCTDTTEVCGEVFADAAYFQIPNAFTPNGDGLNDEFKPISANVEFLRFLVFDRWGNEVFSDKTGLWGWDGKYKSDPMPNGTYFYYFKYRINGKEQIQQGDLTLIR